MCLVSGCSTHKARFRQINKSFDRHRNSLLKFNGYTNPLFIDRIRYTERVADRPLSGVTSGRYLHKGAGLTTSLRF